MSRINVVLQICRSVVNYLYCRFRTKFNIFFYLWPKYCMNYWGFDILKPQIWMTFIFRYINFYVLFYFLCKYFLLPINYYTWNLTRELRTSYRLYTWALLGSKVTRSFRQLRIDIKIKVKDSCDLNDQANECNSKSFFFYKMTY